MTVLSRLRQRLPDRRTSVILAVCIVVAAVLDFLYFTGFFASDDASYLKAARQIADVGNDLPAYPWRGSLASTRLGITIPDGIAYWLSAGDVVTIAWFHVLYHLALVGLAYAIGREAWDARTGLIAAALVATSPVLYVFAGAVLPDNATAVWLAVVLLLLLRVRRRALEGPLGAREAGRRYLVAGLVLGVAYACKETALIMTVPCAAIIVAGAPRLRSWVWVRDGAFLAAGLLVFVLFEAVLLRLITHEWMWRLGGVESSGAVFAERMTTQGTGPFERLVFLADTLRTLMPLTGLALVGAAVAYPFLRRRDVALLAFFWWPLLYLTIGSTSFSAYRPSSIQARYYAIVMLPAAVMGAVVLGELLRRWPARRWVAPALVVVMAAIAVFEARHVVGFGGTIYRCADARAFRVAYDEARSAYPDYPVVLALDYRRRMTPLLFPGDPDVVPEGPPFVQLSPLADALPEGAHVRTVQIVYPPRRRWDVLVQDLRRVLGASPRPLPTTTRGAAVIQLVTE